MNYVREELLRQRAALELLMSGGAGEGPASEAETEVPRDSAFVREEAERNRRLRTAETDGEPVQARRKSGETESSVRRRRSLVEETVFLPERVRETPVFSETVRSGAREVSRIIQRDARRYDGGFTIY